MLLLDRKNLLQVKPLILCWLILCCYLMEKIHGRWNRSNFTSSNLTEIRLSFSGKRSNTIFLQTRLKIIEITIIKIILIWLDLRAMSVVTWWFLPFWMYQSSHLSVSSEVNFNIYQHSDVSVNTLICECWNI